MRVLISCIPQTGHLFPLLPLAEALAAQGDDVLVATGADGAEVVRARGLAFRETGPSFGEWYEALRARTRGVPGDGLPPERVERYFLPRLFGEVGTALVVDDLMDAAAEHSPTLMVFDPVMFAAPLVATKRGIAAVQHTVGPLYDDATLELVADAVSPIWREFGLTVPPAAGMFADTTLAICPPSLDPAAAARPRLEPLRPVDLPAATVPRLPHGYPEPNRPLVYLTLGTFSNTNLDLFRLLLDALTGESVNLLVTVGRDNDPAALGPTAPNVHVTRFLPQNELLPHCAAVMHHAGAGTAFGALAHGLPSVAMPQAADNFTIADRLAAAGAAVTIPPANVTPVAVRDALRLVLTEPTYSAAAGRLAVEIAAMAAPEEVAVRLTELAARHGSPGGSA